MPSWCIRFNWEPLLVSCDIVQSPCQVSHFDPGTDQVRFFAPGKGTRNDQGDPGSSDGAAGEGSGQGTTDNGVTETSSSNVLGGTAQQPLREGETVTSDATAGEVLDQAAEHTDQGVGNPQKAQGVVEKTLSAEAMSSRDHDGDVGAGSEAAKKNSAVEEGNARVEYDGEQAPGLEDGDGEEELQFSALSSVRILRGPSIQELEKRKQAMEKFSSLGTGQCVGSGAAAGGVIGGAAGKGSSSIAASLGGAVGRAGASPAVSTGKKRRGMGRRGRGRERSSRNRGRKRAAGASLLAVGALATAMAQAKTAPPGNVNVPTVGDKS